MVNLQKEKPVGKSDDEHRAHLFPDEVMQKLFLPKHKMSDFDVAVQYPHGDVVSNAYRAPHREVMCDSEASTIDRLEAAGMLACYFHDVYASCMLEDLLAIRLKEVEEDPTTRDNSADGKEKGALLKVLIAQSYFAVNTPDLTSNALHIILPDGFLTRPGHTIAAVGDLYCELGLHRTRAKRFRSKNTVRRMQDAIDAVAASLTCEVADIFAKLDSDKDIKWLGETEADRQLLELDNVAIQQMFDDLLRTRFGGLGGVAVQTDTLF